MKKIKLIVTVLCLQFLALSIFAQEQGEPEAESQSSSLKNFIIVENVREHEFNPHLTSYSSDAQILTGLYEGLFTYDPVNLNPCYAIAINYRISRDKKRWTFTINPDAKFSNGEKITAESVRKSWLKLLATPGAPYSSLLDVIKGAEDFRNGKGTADDVGIYANSEDSLSIHLVKPANYLPKVLCHSAFSVVHEKSDVYSGPFYLAEGSPGFYQMKKNEYYWDKDKVSLEQILFYQSDNEKDNAFYFNTGLADWITANVDTSLLYNKKAISIAAEFATSYFFFKQNDSVWSKTEFRQALLEAVPWEILRKDFYVAAQTFVYPLSGYPQLDGYSYTDMNEAKNLMQQARKKYDIPEDKKLPLVFEMPENSVSEDRLTALCDSWAQLGVDVQIKLKKSYEYYTQVGSSNSDMFIYTWIGDFADPLAFLELFRGNSTLNDSKWINSEYDRLLDEAAECSDEERYRLLAQAEKILLDDCEIIPVHHPVISNVVDKNTVGGWSENAFDIHPLKYLYKKADKSTVPNVVMNLKNGA